MASPERAAASLTPTAAAIGPRAMRRLDRWLGLPLCLLADAALRLGGLFRRRRAAAAPRDRVLYVALAEMGSIVLAASSIRRAAQRYGAAPVFVTLAPTRAVFDFLGGEFAREVFVLRTASLGALCADLWRFAHWARRSGITVAIDLDPGARFSALLALLSGASLRAGFAGADQPYRGRLYTHAVACPAARHMSENFAALVQAPFERASGVAANVVDLRVPAAAPPHPPVPAPLPERLRRLVADGAPQRRIVLIHANCSDPVPQRRWPPQRYVALCRELLAAWPDLLILFVGAAAEEAAAAALCAEIDDARCVAVAGACTVGQLPGLFAAASLLVSSDSGPAHLAAHAGLPVIALFGPETPQRYGPPGATATLYAGLPCSPCLSARNQRTSACRDARCMQAIPVAAVLAAVHAALAPQRLTRTATAATA